MDKRKNDKAAPAESGCDCASSSCCEPPNLITTIGQVVHEGVTRELPAISKVLNIDLIVIDLKTCQRCVPTGDQLRTAVRLLAPVADALGIDLRHREIVVETPEQAKEHALLSSPTIRLNGRDIDQHIRESLCESCGDLTNNNTAVDCREWHYRGKVYSAAPLPLLIESIMGAMLNIDTPPVVPPPLEQVPENLMRYFNDKKPTAGCC
jgi:hypothetical protein